MIMINLLLLKNLIIKSVKFTARLKQVNLASKSDNANFVKKTDFGKKLKDVMSNKK